MSYVFQWGESHSVMSIYNWVARQYGPYAFGKPKKVDFVAFVENSHVDSYASSEMIGEWHKFSEKLLDERFAESLFRDSKKAREEYWNFFNKFRSINLSSL